MTTKTFYLMTQSFRQRKFLRDCIIMSQAPSQKLLVVISKHFLTFLMVILSTSRVMAPNIIFAILILWLRVLTILQSLGRLFIQLLRMANLLPWLPKAELLRRSSFIGQSILLPAEYLPLTDLSMILDLCLDRPPLNIDGIQLILWGC